MAITPDPAEFDRCVECGDYSYLCTETGMCECCLEDVA